MLEGEIERLQQRIHDLEQGITRTHELWSEAVKERGKLMETILLVSDLLEAGADLNAICAVVNRALSK